MSLIYHTAPHQHHQIPLMTVIKSMLLHLGLTQHTNMHTSNPLRREETEIMTVTLYGSLSPGDMMQKAYINCSMGFTEHKPMGFVLMSRM